MVGPGNHELEVVLDATVVPLTVTPSQTTTTQSNHHAQPSQTTTHQSNRHALSSQTTTATQSLQDRSVNHSIGVYGVDGVGVVGGIGGAIIAVADTETQTQPHIFTAFESRYESL